MNTYRLSADNCLWDGPAGFLSRSANMVWDGHAGFLLRSAPASPTLPSMTVCIGSLCMNGTAVVMAADRKVAHLGCNLAGEGPDCKIEQLSSRPLLAAAGELPSAELLEEFKTGRLTEPTAAKAADAVYDACITITPACKLLTKCADQCPRNRTIGEINL